MSQSGASLNRTRFFVVAATAVGLLSLALVLFVIRPFVSRVQREATTLQALANRLDKPLRVCRGKEFGLAGGPGYYLAAYVELPEVTADDIDAIADAINKLSDARVVLVQHTNLGQPDLERLKRRLRPDFMLSIGPIQSSKPIQWDVIHPEKTLPRAKSE